VEISYIAELVPASAHSAKNPLRARGRRKIAFFRLSAAAQGVAFKTPVSARLLGGQQRGAQKLIGAARFSGGICRRG
jgi:hypothetical protein